MAELETLRLHDGANSYPIWIDGGETGIREVSVNPNSIFVAGGGPGVFGRGEPLFATNEQRTWEGGRALESFADDQTRYFDSQNLWTLTPSKMGPAPLRKFGVGYRNAVTSLPGSMTFQPLYGSTLYVSIAVTPAATITADKVYVRVRRIGTPGDLTLELCSDSSGSPGTVLKTTVVDTDTITDYVSVLQVFDHSTTQSLTGSTVYHVKVYGASTDNQADHWEVGVNEAVSTSKYSSDDANWLSAPYSLYYRIVDADLAIRWRFFFLDEALYAVSSYLDLTTASKVYINGARGEATAGAATTLTNSNASFGTASEFDGALVKIIRGTGAGQVRTIASHTGTVLTVSVAWHKTPSTDSEYIIYQSNRWTECATTGLAVVTDVAVYNNIAYFAQGEGSNIRTMRFNPGASPPAHEYQDDGTNKASLLCVAYLSSGPAGTIWRANNDATAAGAVTVSRSAMVAWGTDHTFGTAIKCGNGNFPITGLAEFSDGTNARLYVLKTGEIGYIDTDKWYRLNINLESFPESTNGVASLVHGLYLWLNWSWTLERLYGTALDDIDPNREAGLPTSRQGYISSLLSHPVGVMCSIDADTGTSSIMFYDGINYHEIFRAFESAKRIRSMIWQPNEGGKKFLWVGVGDDLVYIEMPRLHRNPFRDDTQEYEPDFEFISATYDMGNSSIYKVFHDLILATKNLGENVEIRLDYQTDDDIDSMNWTVVDAGTFAESPLQSITIDADQLQRFRYRLRGYTKVKTTPPIVLASVLTGVGQLPIKNIYSFVANVGQTAAKLGMRGSKEFIYRIFRGTRKAKIWTVESSKYNRLDGRKVLVEVNDVKPDYSTNNQDNVTAQITLYALDEVGQ